MPNSPDQPLRMAPSFSTRPWGGVRLREVLGKPVPSSGGPFGESWELSDHPDGPSRIFGGPFDGELFGAVMRAHPQAMVGREQAPERFPLLVKYIDAEQDLSIQVHPDDEYAARTTQGDRGKTECWFIMDCAPKAEMILGLHPGMTRETLAQAIEAKRVPDAVKRLPIHPGMFIYIPAGVVHAVLAGTMLCEVQQSSNTTYRFHDWDREPRRELHIAQSLDVIDYDADVEGAIQVVPDAPEGERQSLELTRNAFFTTEAILLASGAQFECPPCRIVSLVRGGGSCINDMTLMGDTWFVPAACEDAVFTAGAEGATLMVSTSNEL